MQAVKKAKILHRDISAGNILVLEGECRLVKGKLITTYVGLLNDWELSKSLPDGINIEGGQRPPDRKYDYVH